MITIYIGGLVNLQFIPARSCFIDKISFELIQELNPIQTSFQKDSELKEELKKEKKNRQTTRFNLEVVYMNNSSPVIFNVSLDET